jgi:hypothetical protein
MKVIPKSWGLELAKLAGEKMLELRSSGHQNIAVIGSGNGSIRIRSLTPDRTITITEVSITPNWYRDFSAIHGSVNKALRGLNRSFEIPIIPNIFGDGATFGPSDDSALLFLARSANSHPENGELRCEEPLDIAKIENGGSIGINDRSALHIVAALLAEVD